jgi:hypothetical protein
VTRCLNCGAERTQDTCAACGLTSIAAELSLRRHLLNRTAIFLLGALAFMFAAVRYPPLDLDGILIFIGVVFFLTLGLGIIVERRALRHLEVEALKRIYYGLIPVPWLLGGLLLMNGALDRQTPTTRDAKVYGRFSVVGPLPSRRLVLVSWREGHRYERVPVSRTDFDRFHPGDAIVVRVGEGLVGIPWVVGVDRE